MLVTHRAILTDPVRGRDGPILDIVVLGGLPIRGPVAWAGPFVMNTKAEVLQAFADCQKGKRGVVPATSVPRGDRA